MPSQNTLPSRRPFILSAVACALLLVAALGMQHGLGLEPCPLCIFQRLAVIALAVVFVLAAAINPRSWGRRLAGFMTLVIALIGGAIAGRQVWLQHLPEDRVPACGPGLDYLLDVFPLQKVVDLVLRGSGECAEVHWRLLGLSIAEWMIIVFLAFAAFGAVILFHRRRLAVDRTERG